MRALISTVAAGLAFAMFAAHANAGPIIRPGQAAKLPAGCSVNGHGLDCTASAATTLNFSIIIINDTGGMAGYSFGAQWDANLENALTVNSATQGTQSNIEVSAGPPPVTVGFNAFGGNGAPVGPGGVTQSTAGAAGQATNWEATGASPDSNINVQTANTSFRAGRISVTVDSTTGTRLQLGWYNSLQDAFVAGNATSLAEGDITFGYIDFNGGPGPVPEPGTTLLMGLGMLGLIVAGRSSRK
jgi:hypothetical protein